MVGSSFWYTHFLIGKRCPPLAASYIQAKYNKKGARSNVNACVCVWWWRSNFNICPVCIIFSLKIPRSEKKIICTMRAYTPSQLIQRAQIQMKGWYFRNVMEFIEIILDEIYNCCIYAVCRQRAREMLLIKWKYKCICPVAAMLTFIIRNRI